MLKNLFLFAMFLIFTVGGKAQTATQPFFPEGLPTPPYPFGVSLLDLWTAGTGPGPRNLYKGWTPGYYSNGVNVPTGTALSIAQTAFGNIINRKNSDGTACTPDGTTDCGIVMVTWGASVHQQEVCDSTTAGVGGPLAWVLPSAEQGSNYNSSYGGDCVPGSFLSFLGMTASPPSGLPNWNPALFVAPCDVGGNPSNLFIDDSIVGSGSGGTYQMWTACKNNTLGSLAVPAGGTKYATANQVELAWVMSIPFGNGSAIFPASSAGSPVAATCTASGGGLTITSNVASSWGRTANHYPIVVNGTQTWISGIPTSGTVATVANAVTTGPCYFNEVRQELPNTGSSNMQWAAHILAQQLRFSLTEFSHLQVVFLSPGPGTVWVTGQNPPGKSTRYYGQIGQAPLGEETVLSLQTLITEQVAQDASETALTGCSVTSGTETCTWTGNRYDGVAFAPVAGTTYGQISGEGSLNTPCTTGGPAAACDGVLISAVGTNTFSFTTTNTGSASGGHVSIINDPYSGTFMAIGGLETADGTAPVILPGPYDGLNVTRSDGVKSWCQYNDSGDVHPTTASAYWNPATAGNTGCNWSGIACSVDYPGQVSCTANQNTLGGVAVEGDIAMRFFSSCFTANSCSPPSGWTAANGYPLGNAYTYGYGSTALAAILKPIFCASWHQTAGCQ